jgi:ribose 5-phosphate isomerase RpiB
MGGFQVRKVVIGCDPNAANLEGEIEKHLSELGYEYEAYGSDDPFHLIKASACFPQVAKQLKKHHDNQFSFWGYIGIG